MTRLVLEVFFLALFTVFGVFCVFRPLWWFPRMKWLLLIEQQRDIENRIAPRLGIRLYWLAGLIGGVPYAAARGMLASDFVGPETLVATCRLHFGVLALMGTGFAIYLTLNSAWLLLWPRAALRSRWSSPSFISPRWGRISEETGIPITLRLITLFAFLLGAVVTPFPIRVLIDHTTSSGCRF